jgi:hypothetical protein
MQTLLWFLLSQVSVSNGCSHLPQRLWARLSLARQALSLGPLQTNKPHTVASHNHFYKSSVHFQMTLGFCNNDSFLLTLKGVILIYCHILNHYSLTILQSIASIHLGSSNSMLFYLHTCISFILTLVRCDIRIMTSQKNLKDFSFTGTHSKIWNIL